MTDSDGSGFHETSNAFLIDDTGHRTNLAQDAIRQFRFFQASLQDRPGFCTLSQTGAPISNAAQELHATTRLVHSYALGHLAGVPECGVILNHGMRYILDHHHDKDHGGYVWSLAGGRILDDRKLAYGHVFVLLAGASAKLAGHPEADDLIAGCHRCVGPAFLAGRSRSVCR